MTSQIFSSDLKPTKNFIGCLPTEIVMKIFIYSLSFSISDNSSQNWPTLLSAQRRPLPSQPPYVLTEVCQTWRKIAFATPELWEALLFVERDVPESQEHFSKLRCNVLSWFSRTTSQRLSFSASLRPHHFSRSNITSRVPWRRLAHLYLKDDALCPLDLTKMLHECPGLITCHIEGINCVEIALTSLTLKHIQTVELPRLTSLTLTVTKNWTELSLSKPNSLYIFPGLLSTPSLTTLEINGHPDVSYDYILTQIILGMLVNCNAPLTRLCLHNLNPIYFFDYFVDMWTIQHLSLSPKDEDCWTFGTFFQRLAYDINLAQNILPNLVALHLEATVPRRENEPPRFDRALAWDSAILDMVTTRRWKRGAYPHREEGLCQLRELHVLWRGRTWSGSDSAPLHKALDLANDGLDMEYPSLGVSADWPVDLLEKLLKEILI